MLTANKVLSVYSGTNGKCCCGCSGKHSCNPALKEQVIKNLGYDPGPEGFSQKAVTRMINKYNKSPEDWTTENGLAYLVEGNNRLKIIYFLNE